MSDQPVGTEEQRLKGRPMRRLVLALCLIALVIVALALFDRYSSTPKLMATPASPPVEPPVIATLPKPIQPAPETIQHEGAQSINRLPPPPPPSVSNEPLAPGESTGPLKLAQGPANAAADIVPESTGGASRAAAKTAPKASAEPPPPPAASKMAARRHWVRSATGRVPIRRTCSIAAGQTQRARHPDYAGNARHHRTIPGSRRSRCHAEEIESARSQRTRRTEKMTASVADTRTSSSGTKPKSGYVSDRPQGTGSRLNALLANDGHAFSSGRCVRRENCCSPILKESRLEAIPTPTIFP